MSVGDSSFVPYVQWTVYIPTLAIGLPLNLAALWLLLFRIRRWTESTVYLASLVVNDSLLIFSLPFKMYAYDSTWALGRGFCTFLESLVFVNVYGSIALTACIAGDRYVSLRFPFMSKRLRSPRKAALASLALWAMMFAGTTAVRDLHGEENGTTGAAHPDNGTCFQGFSDDTWTKLWIIVVMETVFCASAVAVVFFSVRVMRILGEMRRRNPLDEKLRDNKSVKIVLSNLVAFLLCFVPYHALALVYFLAKNRRAGDYVIAPLRSFVHVSTCVSSVNCLTDGVCYYLILNESLLSARSERKRLSTRGDVGPFPNRPLPSSTSLRSVTPYEVTLTAVEENSK